MSSIPVAALTAHLDKEIAEANWNVRFYEQQAGRALSEPQAAAERAAVAAHGMRAAVLKDLKTWIAAHETGSR